MLEEAEWAQIEPLLKAYVASVREYRNQNHSLEAAAKKGFDRAALDLYFKITGVREANIMSIWHHRVSLYGPPCSECGKPLRNPQARLCAACGNFRELP